VFITHARNGTRHAIGGFVDENLRLIVSPRVAGSYVVHRLTPQGWKQKPITIRKRSFEADGNSYKLERIKM
jgi:hypothetical protein